MSSLPVPPSSVSHLVKDILFNKESTLPIQAASPLQKFKVIKNNEKLEAEKNSEIAQRGKKRRLAKIDRLRRSSKQSHRQRDHSGSNKDDGSFSKGHHTRSRQRRRRARSSKQVKQTDRKSEIFSNNTSSNPNINENVPVSQPVKICSSLKVQNSEPILQNTQFISPEKKLVNQEQVFQPQSRMLISLHKNGSLKQQNQIASAINTSNSSSSGVLSRQKLSVDENSPIFSSGQSFKQLVNIVLEDNQRIRSTQIENKNIVSSPYCPPPTVYQTWECGQQQSSVSFSQVKANTDGDIYNSKNQKDYEDNKIQYGEHRLSVTSSKKNKDHNRRNSQEKKYKDGLNNSIDTINANDMRNKSQNKGNRNPLISTQQKQRLFKTKICYDFLKGKCKNSSTQCKYAHGHSDIRSHNKSSNFCRNFQKGYCKKAEEECRFRHYEARKHDFNTIDIIMPEEKKKEQNKEDKIKQKIQKVQNITVGESLQQNINVPYYLNNTSQIPKNEYNNGYFQQYYQPQNASYFSSTDQSHISQNQFNGYQHSFLPYQYPMYPSPYYPYFNPYQFAYQYHMPNISVVNNPNSQISPCPAYYPSPHSYNYQYTFSEPSPFNHYNIPQPIMAYNFDNHSYSESKFTQNTDNIRLENLHQQKRQQRQPNHKRN